MVAAVGTASDLRLAIRQSLQSQLEKLRVARKEHSHSDLLLPPDLISTALRRDVDKLKSRIDLYIKEGGSDDISFRDVVSNILGVEARELAFAEFQDSLDGQGKLERSHLKNAFDRFDIVLELDKQGLLDTAIPLLIHEEVFDRLPISACSQYFQYIELRKHDLTKDLQPGRGKGLTLLRFCIELVRRLSKPTREHTVFVGRILSLLSSVFPLGERSGVNTRGDFNIDNKTTWEALLSQESEDQIVVKSEEQDDAPSLHDDANGANDESLITSEEPGDTTKAASDEDLMKTIHDPIFYELFWKAQEWFSNPSVLFAVNDEEAKRHLPKDAIDPVQPSSNTSLKTFRIASQYILNVLGAVGRREKELEGKADSTRQEREASIDQVKGNERLPEAGLEVDPSVVQVRKRKAASMLEAAEEAEMKVEEDDDSFFPKYLTDRNIFEYELRDASFRRHIFAQYLIVFQYLLGFTDLQKEKTREWKNQLVATHQATFTLEEGDEKWIRDTWKLIVGLIRETSAEGKTYAETLLQVLRREARWIQWKAENCPPIDQIPMKKDQLEAFVRSKKSFSSPLRPYPHKLGSAALSRLWEDGVRRPEPTLRTMENEEGFEVHVQTDGLDDLEFAPTIPTLQSYASEIVRIERQQELRRKELDWESPQGYAIISLIPAEKRQKEMERLMRESRDDKMQQLEQSRVLNAWRAARLARGMHLDSFAKIKVDDDKSVGLRIDDITGLMRAVDDREKTAKKNAHTIDSVMAQVAQPAPTEALPTQGDDGKPGEDFEMDSFTGTFQPKVKEDGKEEMEGKGGTDDDEVPVHKTQTESNEDTAMHS